jgi:hypothetical protein
VCRTTESLGRGEKAFGVAHEGVAAERAFIREISLALRPLLSPFFRSFPFFVLIPTNGYGMIEPGPGPFLERNFGPSWNMEVQVMILSNPAVLLPEIPEVDANEVRWAVEYLTLMIARVGADSAVGMILRQARRELQSLLAENGAEATVVGPLRIAA